MQRSPETPATPRIAAVEERLNREFPAGGALDGRLFSRLIDDAPEDLPAGTEIGRWHLGRRLGRGGSSTVYLAERVDGHHRLQAALKIVRAKCALVEQCRREREILASLDHPAIVDLIDGDDIDDGRAWLAMEPVFGERIDDHVRASRLAFGDRLAMFEEVCDAVSHVHERKLIHCDIKPSNLLVDRTGRPRLLDFGIAMKEGIRPRDRYLAMTPIYASPEQRAGGIVTTASDIYQLGALLHVLAGDEAGLAAAAGRVRCKTVQLDGIVRRATAQDPAHRFATVAELRASVAELRSGTNRADD